MGFSVPLNALRTFEAAARHMSIKEGAFELSLTPSAVSYRLRILENALGRELFLRSRMGRASNSRKPERHLHRR